MSQLLLAELTALSSECKRKHPEVKTAADAALTRLRADQDATLRDAAAVDVAKARQARGGAPGPEETGENNVLLKPILLATGPKTSPKATGLAVGLLHRIVLLKVVPEAALPNLVDVLTTLALSRTDVEIHLKLLQVVGSLFSTHSAVIHDALLAKLLQMVFKLHASKVAVVSSTAAATLRQAVMVVFESVKHEDRVLDALKGGDEDAAASAPLAAMTVAVPGREPVTLFPASKDAYLMLSDLNALASGDEAPFLKLTSVPRTFALELVESVLTNHAALFRSTSHPELLLCLRNATCPLLIRALSEQPSFPRTVRLMRLLFVLLRQFGDELVVEVEILMSILLRFIHPSNNAGKQAGASGIQDANSSAMAVPHWLRLIALEIARSLCSDLDFLRHHYVWFDATGSSARVFGGLVDALQAVAAEKPRIVARAPTDLQMGGEDTHAQPRASREAPRSAGRSGERGLAGLYEAAAGVANVMLSAQGGGDAEKSGEQGAELGQGSAPAVQLIDQLDKAEAPAASPTYLSLLALQSLVHLAQAISSFVLPVYSSFVNARPKGTSRAPPALDVSTLEAKQRKQVDEVTAMIQLAWPSILAGFTFYLSAHCDDVLFAEVLTALRNFTNSTGVLGMAAARDALIASLARFAIPRTVLHRLEEARGPTGDDDAAGDQAPALSYRNAACLKVVTQIGWYLSGILGTHWRDVLETLCDAEYVLRRTGSRRRRAGASTAGEEGDAAARSSAAPSGSNATSAFMAASAIDQQTGRPAALSGLDSASLLADIARVFENTAAFDGPAFVAFLGALCELSADTIGIPSDGPIPDPSSQGTVRSSVTTAQRSFPLASLETVASLNVQRLSLNEPEQGWRGVVQHMHLVASHPHVRPNLRAQAAKALHSFLFASFGCCDEARKVSTSGDVERLQRQVVDALCRQAVLEHRRASASDVEVRRMALETLLKLLEAFGHSIVLGWETIFDACVSACAPHNPAAPSAQQAQQAQALTGARSVTPLVKAAFPCLQIICSDLLHSLSLAQLEQSIGTLTAFSVQAEDVNVALTANGALWGISSELAAREGSAGQDEALLGDIAQRWTCLLKALLRVSADSRAEVRNGAISNLFRVLEQYGASLPPQIWTDSVALEVLFPLLHSLRSSEESARVEQQSKAVDVEEVAKQDARAAAMGVPQSSVKQWQESRVLAFASLGRVMAQFVTPKLSAAGPDRFKTVWQQLSEATRTAFLEGPASISQSSVDALAVVLRDALPAAQSRGEGDPLREAWASAWQTWCGMGEGIAASPSAFTQKNLLAFVEVSKPLYALLGPTLTLAQHQDMSAILKTCLTYRRSSDQASDVDAMTPLQAAVRSSILSWKTAPGMPSLVLSDLAEFAMLAFTAPVPSSPSTSAATYVALHKSAAADALRLSREWRDELELLTSGALVRVMASLALPIKLKYDCPAANKWAKADALALPLWRSATLVFLDMAAECCAVLEQRGGELGDESVEALWRQMVSVFDAALTAESAAPGQVSPEEEQADEVFDLSLLATLETRIVAHLGGPRVPSSAIVDLSRALASASKLWLSASNAETPSATEKPRIKGSGSVAPSSENPRELFAYWALELLFLICSDRWEDRLDARRRVASLSLPILLERCRLSLEAYVADAALRGASPFPRIRSEEVCCILSLMLDLRLWPGTLSAQKASSDGQREGSEEGEEALSSEMRSLAAASPRAHLFSTFGSLCDLVAIPTPTATATLRHATQPGSSKGLLVPLTLPEGIELGRIGKANPLGSSRLDRDGPQDIRALARKALSIVGAAWAP